MSKRTQSDERLDRLYMKSMRCPYCHSKIERGASTCKNCGITKEQIYHANLVIKTKKKKDKRERVKPQIIMSKVRPSNIPFWKMALGGMFGFLGIHCFLSKRHWRGWLILGSFLIFFIFGMIFNPSFTDIATGETVASHAVRKMFESKGLFFPTDIFGLVAFGLWVWDWSCILLGTYKYPVVLKTEDDE